MGDVLLHFFHQSEFVEISTSRFTTNTLTIGQGPYDTIRPGKLPLLEHHATIERYGDHWLISASEGAVVRQDGKPVGSKPQPFEQDIIYILVKSGQKIPMIARNPDAYPEPVSAYLLDAVQEISVGRNEKNMIFINDRMVSDRHATLILKNRQWVLIDENSTNGVFVNGNKKTEAVLNNGDRIVISGHKFRFDENSIFVPTQNSSIYVRGLSSRKKKVKPYPWFQLSPRFLQPVPAGEITIPAPPMAMTQPNINWLMVLLPSASILLVSGALALTLGNGMTSMFMMLGSTGTSLLVSIVNYNSQKKKFTETEQERNDGYLKLIDMKKSEIQKVYDVQRAMMLESNPTPQECEKCVVERNRHLWERTTSHDDFLSIRLGIGSLPLSTKVKFPEQQGIHVDELLKKAKEAMNPYLMLKNIPVSISLQDTPSLGIIGTRTQTAALGRSILMHLAALHTYEEMKLVVITSQQEDKEWNWARWLPHLWDENQERRFYIRDKSSVTELLSEIVNKLQLREAQTKENSLFSSDASTPAYVFFITDINLIANEPIVRFLQMLGKDLGIYAIYLGEIFERLPRNCSCIVQLKSGVSEYFLQSNRSHCIAFTSDETNVAEAEAFARLLAPIRIANLSKSMDIPKRVTFLEMMGVGRVEDIAIQDFWKCNRTDESLAVPVGLKAGHERMMIDLQEGDGKDGPHSMVAGMARSGKSEFMQSLILSLAIHYSPSNVNFVLIDYKGGSMAQYFKGIPHLAGIITNLGGNQTHRALLSVQGEIKRREELLSISGDKDINSYQKQYFSGNRKESLPHLFIIVDEFAELKKEKPEFIDGLVSAARKGGSLGVRLILATQSPGGVIDTAIRDNTRFYACLKVRNTEDSKEMIGSSDASALTLSGRVITRADQRIIHFQSAWSGADYTSINPVSKKVRVREVEASGKRVSLSQSVFKQDSVNMGTELDAVIDVLEAMGKNPALPKIRSLWTPPLPTKISVVTRYLTEEKILDYWKDTTSWMKPVVGLVDIPSRQVQVPLEVEFSRSGHLAILGMPSSGKTTFLKTLIIATAIQNSPDDVWMYILDCGGRTMSMFEALPHVGAVITPDMAEEIKGLMRILTNEIDARKKLFSSRGVSTLKSYRQSCDCKIPAFLIVIDNYSVLLDAAPDMEELILRISSEGGGLGIYLAISANTLNALKYRLTSNIGNPIALQFTDRAEYSSIFGSGRIAIEPEFHPGRGLVKAETALEFQTLLPSGGETEYEQTDNLKEICLLMASLWKGTSARRIPRMPDRLTLEFLNDLWREEDRYMFTWNTPVGLITHSVELMTLDLSQITHLLVTGTARSGKTSCLRALVSSIVAYHAESAVIFLMDSSRKDFRQKRESWKPEGYAATTKDYTVQLANAIAYAEKLRNEVDANDENADRNTETGSTSNKYDVGSAESNMIENTSIESNNIGSNNIETNHFKTNNTVSKSFENTNIGSYHIENTNTDSNSNKNANTESTNIGSYHFENTNTESRNAANTNTANTGVVIETDFSFVQQGQNNDEDKVNRKPKQIFIVIADFIEFVDMIDFQEKAQLENIIRKGRFLGIHVLTTANAQEISAVWDGPSKALKDISAGIVLSEQCEQQVFNARLTMNEINRPLKQGEGFFIDKSSIIRVKWPMI